MDKDFNYFFIRRDMSLGDLGSFSDDFETMKEFVDKKGELAFFCASDRLKNDKNFVLYSINRDCFTWYALYTVGNRLAFDKDVIIATIYSRNFDNMICEIEGADFFAMIFEDEYLKHDLDIILAIAEVDPNILLLTLDDVITSDKNAILRLLEKSGYFLQVASDDLKDDEDVVLEAISNDVEAFQFASSRLRYNKKIVSYALNCIVYNMENYDIQTINDVFDIIIKNTNVECIKYIIEYISNYLISDIDKVKKKNF